MNRVMKAIYRTKNALYNLKVRGGICYGNIKL